MSDVSLKEYCDRMLAEQDRRIQQAQAAAKEAVQKAEKAIDKRLDLLNEFRAQNADKESKYATIEHIDALKEKIEIIESRFNKAHGAILLIALIGVANLVKLFWGE